MKPVLLFIVLAIAPQTLFAVSGGDSGTNINWGDVDQCISGCTFCIERKSTACCTKCGDAGSGGGGGGIACTTYATCTSISGREEYQDTGSAAVVGDMGNAGSTNVCFDINGIKYYKKSATSCKANYSRVKFTIQGCTTIVYYQCMYNYTSPGTGGTCDESTCIPDAWTMVTSGNNAVQRRTFRQCSGNACITTLPDQLRCPTGYYGTPKLSGFGANATVSSYCTPCPSDTSGRQTTAGPGEVADNGIGIGGGTNAGTVDITECYIPVGVGGSDSTGNWEYVSNCYYSN